MWFGWGLGRGRGSAASKLSAESGQNRSVDINLRLPAEHFRIRFYSDGAHHGFHVIERKFPVCRGVTLQNARMRKALGSANRR